ncbi:1620_t:CDS:1, partial [Funneliformis mosseae]
NLHGLEEYFIVVRRLPEEENSKYCNQNSGNARHQYQGWGAFRMNSTILTWIKWSTILYITAYKDRWYGK